LGARLGVLKRNGYNGVVVKQEIIYQLKRSKRAKRARLSVHDDGSIIVTVPQGVGRSAVEKFLAEKREWILDKIRFFKNTNRKSVRTFSRKDYLANKERARVLAHERIKFFNQTYGFSFNKIFIKNQKTRWGSCSEKGNLNLNYKIMFLPERHRDYIIVHELCHLKQLNHSPEFWALVAKTFPDHRTLRRELRNRELLYR